MVILDLGCGMHKQDENATGVDIVPGEGVDVVWDLESYPWPFEDEYADTVVMSHFWEHLNEPIPFMNELYRVMKTGGTAILVSPYYSSARAWQDPTHKHAVSEHSFLYYNAGWRKKENLSHMAITCDFDFSFGFFFAEEWKNRSDEAKQFALKHYINVVDDIQVILVKK